IHQQDDDQRRDSSGRKRVDVIECLLDSSSDETDNDNINIEKLHNILWLTFGEICHIRYVLIQTILCVDKQYSEIVSGHICFRCRKTINQLFFLPSFFHFNNYEKCFICQQIICRIQAETMEITVALICQHSSNNSNYKRIKEQVEHLIHRHEILFTGMHRKLDSLSIKINKNEKNRQDIIDDLLCHDLTIIFNHLIQNNNISWGKIITILAFSTFIARKHNDISDSIAYV
ncbi:unnamed protein product, partial [Rotaria sp. Silwood1]